MTDNDTLEESDGGKQRLEVWKEERERAERLRLGRWTRSLMTVVAVLLPWVGFIWGTVICLRNEPDERSRGLQFLGWALLGTILWAAIFDQTGFGGLFPIWRF